jgi:hypothetical protein
MPSPSLAGTRLALLLCATFAQTAKTVDRKEYPLSYLRFTPTEYRLLSSTYDRFDLAKHSLPAFRRLLTMALADESPRLARKVERLRQGEAELLFYHFRPRPAAAVRHDLSDEELSTFAEVCGAMAFLVRFVRPFQRAFVETLEELEPELAAKVDRMSGYAFEQLYNRAVGRECWEV